VGEGIFEFNTGAQYCRHITQQLELIVQAGEYDL